MPRQTRMRHPVTPKRSASRPRTGRPVKIAPYVVPTRRKAPDYSAIMVPTKWVKFVSALFLLPLCVLLSQTFFSVFARATVTQRFWAAEEFWFFSLGVVLWLIAFFGLPKPLVMYVFGHELTHAIWVWLMGGRVSDFKVGRNGGHVITTKNNFWIALAPYFFPIYSILALGLYGLASLAFDMQPLGRLLYAIIGVTWAFHLTFTVWMIPKSQTDLTANGTFFSLVLIYLMNLLLLSVMLIVASAPITFANFGAEFAENLSGFSSWIDGIVEAFARGYQHG